MSSLLPAPAHAKVNLSLEIVGRRLDGYHDLVSIMQTISLHDSLTFEPANELTLQCNIPSLASGDNLVLRAARALQGRYSVRRGCSIYLQKAIPVAAGLGGGSSDAACTLLNLTKLWDLRPSEDDLCALAADIGSDVPFFLRGGTALVQGKGERVQSFSAPKRAWCTLAACRRVSVSTLQVYGEFRATEQTDGSTTRRLAARLARGRMWRVGWNGLQAAVFRLHPEVQACFDALARLAPGRTLVSGSGGTVFALSPSLAEAEKLSQIMKQRGFWTSVERACAPGPIATVSG
jgi:4-diphosphocytidyl-2-C-methyl-D-erythritol kinase